MVVTLTKKQVNEIAKALGQVMPRKTSVPVLGHVLLEPGGDGRLQATATDLEQTLAMRFVPERLDGAMERFLFPMAELKRLAKSLPRNGTATLQPMGEDGLACTTGSDGQRLSRMVPAMPVSEFPDVSVQADMANHDLGAFLRAYRQAAFSTHADSGRPVLHAVYADQENRVLVGTDGHRLTRSPLTVFPFPGDAILPLTKVLLKGFPESAQGRIGLHEQDEVQTLVIATDELTYSCRCPEGTFPNYRQVIPDMPASASTLGFGQRDLDAISPLLSFLNENLQHGLRFAARRSGVTVAICSDGDDRTTIALPDCRLEGADTTFAVNGKFLMEALERGFLTVRVRDSQTPFAFDDGTGGLHLLMPLRSGPETAQQEPSEANPQPVANPDPATTPSNPPETKPMPEPGTATPTTQQPTRNMQFVQDDETEDPVARLEELVGETQELVKQANVSMREVKKQLRVVKTHFRDREKQIGSREKEMEKSLTLIQRLQETIAA